MRTGAKGRLVAWRGPCFQCKIPLLCPIWLSKTDSFRSHTLYGWHKTRVSVSTPYERGKRRSFSNPAYMNKEAERILETMRTRKKAFSRGALWGSEKGFKSVISPSVAVKIVSDWHKCQTIGHVISPLPADVRVIARILYMRSGPSYFWTLRTHPPNVLDDRCYGCVMVLWLYCCHLRTQKLCVWNLYTPCGEWERADKTEDNLTSSRVD